MAYVRTSNFDGLLFSSTQREDGTNVVLFPKNYNRNAFVADVDLLERFSLKYIEESVELHKTRRIEYEMSKVNFFFLDDGTIHLHDHEFGED